MYKTQLSLLFQAFGLCLEKDETLKVPGSGVESAVPRALKRCLPSGEWYSRRTTTETTAVSKRKPNSALVTALGTQGHTSFSSGARAS